MKKNGTRDWQLLFASQPYRNLWLGQTVSYFGNSVYSLAISWQVYTLTGSSVQVALLLISAFLPQMLLGLFLGAAADRWNRKLLMMLSDWVRAIATAALALSFALDWFALWQIYLVTICLSLSDLLFSTSQNAMLPELVAKEHLLRANSLMATSRQLNRLIGATAGGLLVATFGAVWAIGINSLTFLVSLFFLYRLILPHSEQERPSPERPAKPPLWTEAKAGLAWLKSQPILLVLILIGMISNIALGPTNVLPSMYIQDELGADSHALGLFDGAIALGLIAGGLLVSLLAPKRIGLWFLTGLGLQGIGMLFVAVAGHLYIACLGNLLLGLAVMLASLPMSTLLQLLTPSDMRGRVNSVMTMGLNLAIPVTYGGIGIIGEWLGSRNTYGLGATLLFACVLVGLCFSRLRHYHIHNETKPVSQS